MKKNSTASGKPRQNKTAKKPSKGAPPRQQPSARPARPPIAIAGKGSAIPELTIGLDLGDRTSRYCAVDGHGQILFERGVATTREGLTEVFGALASCRVALEVGTHSPWVSQLLSLLGHEVIVANARQVKLISASSRKSDRVDAQTLARLARADPELLRPIHHRGEQAHGQLTMIRVRANLLAARTDLINAARGLVKSHGERLPACDADQMKESKLAGLPAWLRSTLQPLVAMVESLTVKIGELGRQLEQIAREQYPECARLRQVVGVGPLISLAFVLTIEDPQRFAHSRDVGCYVGLRPRQGDSGESQPQLRITKEGDSYLRQLLVQGAHVIVSKRGPDTDLRRWGCQKAERGGKNARKRAIVGVARRLAVLLHRLWVSGEPYEPLRQARLEAEKKAAA